MVDKHFDIAIVGGGLVGASLACALAPTCLRVALIEAVPFKSDAQPSYDERMLALAFGTQQTLSAIGVWPEVVRRGATPIKQIHISDRGHAGFTRLSSVDAGVEALGQVVPARALGQALVAHMEAHTRTAVICPGELSQIRRHVDHALLDISHEGSAMTIRCDLTVLADGGRSPMRDLLGIAAHTHDYGQSAVLTTVTPERGHNNVAYERFTESGPLALLPTSQDRYAVVWTAKTDQVPELMALSDLEFLQRLQQRFGDRVGALQQLGRRKSYPLTLVRVPSPLAERVIVIGNAAHTIHPVSGQGFNLGLRDVAALAEVLDGAKRAGNDLGSDSVLRSYVNWRQRDVRATTAFTDSLVRVFSNDWLPLVWLRGAGMLAVDMIPPLKRLLLRRTMGLAGRVPLLGRGLPLG